MDYNERPRKTLTAKILTRNQKNNINREKSVVS